MSRYTIIISLSLVGLISLACSTEPAAPPTSKSAKKGGSASVDKSASDTSKLDSKDPLAAFLDNGEEKTPGQLRENQIYNLDNKASRVNSLADTLSRNCFKMSTNQIDRELNKGLTPLNTATGAGAAVSGIGQIGVGVLAGSLGGNMGSSISGVAGAVGKSFGDGVSAEINKGEIKAGISYVNSLEAQDMATCEAKVKNLKAQAAALYRQMNDLRNMGTE